MTELRAPGRPKGKYRLFLGLYRAALWAAEPLVWRYFRRRTEKDPRYGAHLDERRGSGGDFKADLWVHAVSLGEMTSAEPLVRLALDDGMRVLTTHATPAGRTRAEATFAEAIAAGKLAVRYAPIDRLPYWRAFLARHRPRAALVMEMEFWPEMLEAAATAGVPLVLTNSQIPARSLGRARWQARLFGHPATRAAAVFAKSPMMAERFRAVGVKIIEVLGETRFDMALPAAQLAAGAHLKAKLGDRPVLCLASVVNGEEDIYASAVQTLLAGPNPPFVIWVPRAPELFEATETLLADQGFKLATRGSTFDADLGLQSDLAEVDVLLGNSLGEMAFYIAASDAVLVGGGFTPKGTHNVIEPLAQGRPVITGPDTRTIEFPGVEAREAEVLTVCATPDDLVPAIREALTKDAGGAAAFHATHAGASARIYAAVRPVLTEDR